MTDARNNFIMRTDYFRYLAGLLFFAFIVIIWLFFLPSKFPFRDIYQCLYIGDLDISIDGQNVAFEFEAEHNGRHEVVILLSNFSPEDYFSDRAAIGCFR